MTSRYGGVVILIFHLIFFSHLSLATGQSEFDLEAELADELGFLQAEMVVVTASRTKQSVIESPSAISVVTRREIKYSPARNIPELLQYVVGMDGYTKTHTDMDVAARGFAFDETPKMLILLDGQPLNVVPYSGMQWPTLPLTLEDVERIEVLRGPGSAVYGADALVGVVNIITRKADSVKSNITMSYGERNAGSADLHFAQKLNDKLGISVTAGYLTTEGKGDEETSEASSAAPNHDIKDWAEVTLGSYRLDYNADSFDFFSWGGYSSDEEGYNPSPGDASVDKSRKKTTIFNNQLTVKRGKDELMLRLGYRGLDQENERFGDGEYQFKYRVRKASGIDSDLQYTMKSLDDDHTLIFGANLSKQEASRDIANDPPYIYDEKDSLWGVYAQDQWSLFDGRALLTLGARYDKWETLDGVFTPRAVANVFFMDRKATLRVAASNSFRRPGFDENFYYVSWPTGWFKGHAIDEVTENGVSLKGSNLGPEKLQAYEIGLRWEPASDRIFSLEYFHNRVEDIIGYSVYYSNNDTGELNLGFANTSDTIIINGFELEAKGRVSNSFRGFLNYTYQWAELENENGATARWENAPEHKLSAGINYSGYVNVDLRGRYVSAVTYQEIPDVAVDSYTTLDMAISKEIAGKHFVKLSASNILDNRHYEYPLYTKITRRLILSFQYAF